MRGKNCSLLLSFLLATFLFLSVFVNNTLAQTCDVVFNNVCYYNGMSCGNEGCFSPLDIQSCKNAGYDGCRSPSAPLGGRTRGWCCYNAPAFVCTPGQQNFTCTGTCEKPDTGISCPAGEGALEFSTCRTDGSGYDSTYSCSVNCTGCPPPEPGCTSDGSCSAPTPACGQTTQGTDNCGNPCSRTGPACPPPPPSGPTCNYNRSYNQCCGSSLSQNVDEYVFSNGTGVCNSVVGSCNQFDPACAPASASLNNFSGPSCATSAYSSSLSWSGTPLPSIASCPNGFWVDIDDNSSFSSYSNRCVQGTSLSTTGSDFGGPGGSFSFQPSVTYYARVYNGSHSNTLSLTTPSCTASCNLTATCNASTGACTFNSTYSVGGVNQSSYQVNLTPDINSGTQTGWRGNGTISHTYQPGNYTARLDTRQNDGTGQTSCTTPVSIQQKWIPPACSGTTFSGCSLQNQPRCSDWGNSSYQGWTQDLWNKCQNACSRSDPNAFCAPTTLPTCSLSANPPSAQSPPLTTTLSALVDTSGMPASKRSRWDCNGDGDFEAKDTSSTHPCTYFSSGTFNPAFKVVDGGSSPEKDLSQACSTPVSVGTAAPTVSTSLSCINSGYSGSGFNISWTNSGVTWVDIDSDSGFATPYYHKAVSGVLSTTGPSGFNANNGSGSLSLNPDTTYFVRTFNGVQNSQIRPFTTPASCTTTAQPDLITTSLAPATQIQGSSSPAFSATVRNQGNGSATAVSSTRLRIDTGGDGSFDTTAANRSTGFLTAGGSEAESWSGVWSAPACPGATACNHRFEVCTDIGNAVSESNENNNCSIQNFTVAPTGGSAIIPGAFSQNTPVGGCLSTSPYVDLSWTASSGAASYSIFRNSTQIASGLLQLNWRDTGVISSTSYTYSIRAINTSGLRDSNQQPVTTLNCSGGAVCGNNTCESGEPVSCPLDCPGITPPPGGPVCPNQRCEVGETPSSCPADCPSTGPTCGNNTCESGELISCPADCPGGPACSGTINLTLSPNPVSPSGSVSATASGLNNCTSIPITVTTPTGTVSCTSGSTGCTTPPFSAPASPGNFPVTGCVDKNNNGNCTNPGESTSTTLTVNPPGSFSNCAWIQTTGGDVHSNTGINTLCGP